MRNTFTLEQAKFCDQQRRRFKTWVDMMKSLLDKDFWVTLDFGIEYMEQVTAQV